MLILKKKWKYIKYRNRYSKAKKTCNKLKNIKKSSQRVDLIKYLKVHK